jgi:hypothetical protein
VLQRIELLAEISVARGCGFAGLAILTFMLGLSWDMALASEVGGALILGVCMILIIKGHVAPNRPVRKTELWMMLDQGDRPNPAIAQRVIGPVLHTCYLRFALHAAALSASLLAFSACLQWLRGGL